jgi:hypothetical protein
MDKFDTLLERTNQLSNIIHECIARIKQLKLEMIGASDELKHANKQLINDRLLKIQKAIGVFWKESMEATTIYCSCCSPYFYENL